jgi:transposase
LLPGWVRTYAPRAQTPILHIPEPRDHLAASGGVTADGRLLQQVRDHPLNSLDVVRFLKHLRAQVPGLLLVIWDGAPIHRGQPVKAFLTSSAARRLRLEALPGYAPDLNPLDQGIWHYLKNVELANVCCATLHHLRHELRQAIARLRHKRSIIHGAIRHAGYLL